MESNLEEVALRILLVVFYQVPKGILLLTWSILISILEPFVPKRFFHKDVQNQVVLITGAGSGFGRLLAFKFALQHGARVVLWDINKIGLDETADEIKAQGGKAYPFVVDVCSKEEIYATVQKVEHQIGKVDILINNAGIMESGRLVDVSDAKVERSFRINILAHFWTTRAVFPSMLEAKRGHIVTIASAAGLTGVPKLTAYCGTKFAAVGFHESIAAEIKYCYPESDIKTTMICPYFVRTPLISRGDVEVTSNFFLPIRNPEPVVDEMMDAILTNQERIIPSIGTRYMLYIRSNLPSRVISQLEDFGLLKFMMPEIINQVKPDEEPKPNTNKDQLHFHLYSSRSSQKLA